MITPCPGRVQPKAATMPLFAQTEVWRHLREKARGCWAFQIRARAEVGKLTAEIHRRERNGA